MSDTLEWVILHSQASRDSSNVEEFQIEITELHNHYLLVLSAMLVLGQAAFQSSELEPIWNQYELYSRPARFKNELYMGHGATSTP